MRAISPLLCLAFLTAPVAAKDPILVAAANGSLTLTEAIESDVPALALQPFARPTRNAAHARAKAEAQAEVDRAFQEATAQAREAARVPRPR